MLGFNKLPFKQKIIVSAIIITFIPLLLSYGIFINDKLTSIEERIKINLRDISSFIINEPLIQNKLYHEENDGSIQTYTKKFIGTFEDIDIIVIGDMTGEKYSHLDETQVGEIYVNPDNHDVIAYGESYYSLMEGSMGKTFRWFEPIMYGDEQVGFIMVGKYNQAIAQVNSKTTLSYVGLFILSLGISIISSRIFAKQIKTAILDMEPEEIATLYSQKKIVIDSVKDGIIAINKEGEVTEINQRCYELIPNFSIDKVVYKLHPYIENKEKVQMKELIIQGKKIFVTIHPIINNDIYLGVVIMLSKREDIDKVAKEITGIDEVVKNLRANVHEFKNSLHVILGLLQIKEYDRAKQYISEIHQVQSSHSNKFSTIQDPYVKALLMSRELVAKERQVALKLSDESFLNETHDYVDSYDIVTILGNLIENAMEACAQSSVEDKLVEVSLYEDEKLIEIQVVDNGVLIPEDLKNKLLEEGVTSKGEGRGVGLALVKNRVDVYSGNIQIKQFKSQKSFRITILKGE